MKRLLYRNPFLDLQTFLRDIRENPQQWMSRFVFLLGPLVSFWYVEILNENELFHDLRNWQIAMNLIWYYSFFVLCRLILGRIRRAAAVGALTFFAVGIVNHYVLCFRGRILFPADVAGWRTATNVADGFDFDSDMYIVQAAILLISYLFLVWMCPAQHSRQKLPLWLGGIVTAAIGVYGFVFFKTDMLPNMGIYTQQWVTQANGFVLNFTVAMRYSSVDKPADYDRDTVLELLQRYPAVEGDGEKPVNIVVIMNESYSDLTIFDALEVNEDPNPFYHSLTENTVKGFMYAPVTGGGTASTEFEFMTGFPTLFQPPHTVAYQLYVEEDMPSIAALAGAQGYETTAFHPYKSSGWNRPIAYQCLSFDHQMYEEDVRNGVYVRNYVSDSSCYEEIYGVTEEVNARAEDAFVFTVTMQNHSGYAQGWKNLPHSITLSPSLKEADATAEQYLSLVRESDRALEELIAYYSSIDEPTMVVFFGDHQPPLKNAFYEKLYGKKLSERTTQEVLQQYMTPFFIWANYDIEEQSDVMLSTNYLSVLTAQMAGLPLTNYMSFLSDLYETLPVITPVGCIDADGIYYAKDELDGELAQRLADYEMLSYCGMIDLFDEARPFYCSSENEE